MASGHGSSPLPRGGRDGIYHKERDPPPPRCRTICSLPDVCPKEPTGGNSCSLWTVYSSKVNLPAALNDPRLAKRESDFFTKTWGLDFAETEVMPSFYLPNITREHFGPYLQEMAQRERIHERCKTICPNKDDVDAVSNKSRAELEQVPKIFMKPDFALEDPATFNAVLPWSHFNSAGGKSSRDVASSKLLQEKLSHYLDVVEVSIARQISLRSEAFFHAMSSQHELQDRLEETQRAVAVLRGRTAAIDRVMCQGPLRAVRTALTRNNCVKLHNKLKLMAAVHQTQPTVQLLLSTSEFVGALELISTTKEVLQQELQGIHSFRHLGSQLCELEKLIDKMMVEDFSMYARSDLNRSLKDEPLVLEKERLESLVFGLLRQRKLDFLDIYSEEMILAAKAIVSQCVAENVLLIEDIDTEVVTKLADQMRLMTFPQWFELLKTVFESFLLFLQKIKATLSVIKNVVLEVLASNQRNRLLEEAGSAPPVQEAPDGLSLLQGEAELAYLTHEGLFISDALNEASRIQQSRAEADGSESASGATESFVSRDMDGFFSKFVCVFPLCVVCKCVFVFRSGDNMMPSDLELNRVINNIQELLHTASDVSHDRCVKVLTARAKDGSLERLSSAEFVCLSRAVEGFVRDTEELCGRRSVSLRGALQSQANRFVHRFHEERKTKLSLLLDNERWKQAEVPSEFQDLVNSIADGRITLPERKIPGPEDRKPTEFLLVNGQKYAVIGTVLLLIRIFLEYCQCVNDIPSIATDMLTRLSDLLKHFNSRSCQLVLGAGALQVVGLKTITTKNLALASRCLQLVVHYIPIIRAHFETKLQPKQFSVLRHFDHITKDYNDHIAEISAKLVAIMDSLFEKVLSKYEVKAPMPSACFRNVCKQMAKMHEAISELLPEEQTQMLFLRINASFKLHLKRQLARLGVVNDGGPQNGLVVVDVAFYTENVQALKSLDQLDLNMVEIWEQKR
uniref:Vacuolar protein sorting-associated protein 54 n=1 Tax=Sander lucioperca TaxID=283035 RepID=A0A8D0CW45_SANLU